MSMIDDVDVVGNFENWEWAVIAGPPSYRYFKTITGPECLLLRDGQRWPLPPSRPIGATCKTQTWSTTPIIKYHHQQLNNQQHIYASCHLIIIHPIELHSGSLKKCSFNACWRNTVGRKRKRNWSTKNVERTMTNATTTFLLVAAHRHHRHSWT